MDVERARARAIREALKVTLLGISIGLLACGGGGDGGPTGPQFPNVRGTYTGNWIVVAREEASGEMITFTCPGSFTINSQTSASFSGTFLILSTAECDAVTGTLTGTVRTDGGVTVAIDVPGGDPNAFADLTGCAFVSGGSSFSGSVQNSQMSLTVTFDTDCELEGETFRISWTVTFQGST